jgi:hypothetical protein
MVLTKQGHAVVRDPPEDAQGTHGIAVAADLLADLPG